MPHLYLQFKRNDLIASISLLNISNLQLKSIEIEAKLSESTFLPFSFQEMLCGMVHQINFDLVVPIVMMMMTTD